MLFLVLHTVSGLWYLKQYVSCLFLNWILSIEIHAFHCPYSLHKTMSKLHPEYVLSLLQSFHSSSYPSPKDRDITVTSHIQITDWPSSLEDGITVYRKEGSWMRHCQSKKTWSPTQEERGPPTSLPFPFQYIWLQWCLIQRLLWEWVQSSLRCSSSLFLNFAFHIIEVKRTGFVTIVL